VPEYGALGVAVATCITLVAQNLLNQLGLRRALGTALVDRAYLRTYASLVVAAAALFGLRQAAEPGLIVALVATCLTTLLLLVVNRPVLALADSFPELRRIPGLRWLVSG